MARPNNPRTRSRKRRSAARAAGEQARTAAPVARPPRRERQGERPHPPWYPLPLSELLILVGAIATVIGLGRGEGGHAVVIAGIGAVALGTIEVTLREHLGGYRSHTLILALLPAVALHTCVILLLATFTRVPRAVQLGLLPLDVGVFALCFKLLRARFIQAQHRRSLAG